MRHTEWHSESELKRKPNLNPKSEREGLNKKGMSIMRRMAPHQQRLPECECTFNKLIAASKPNVYLALHCHCRHCHRSRCSTAIAVAALAATAVLLIVDWARALAAAPAGCHCCCARLAESTREIAGRTTE